MFFLISFLDCLLLVYRKTTGALCTALTCKLLNLLFSSSLCGWFSVGFSVYKITPSASGGSLTLSFLVRMRFISPVASLPWLELPGRGPLGLVLFFRVYFLLLGLCIQSWVALL